MPRPVPITVMADVLGVDQDHMPITLEFGGRMWTLTTPEPMRNTYIYSCAQDTIILHVVVQE